FDVRLLTRELLDDDRSTTLPIIAVAGDSPAGSAPQAVAALPAARRVLDLPAAHGFALRVDRHRAAAFWDALAPPPAAAGRRPAALARGLSRIWLDRRVAASLDRSV